MDLHGANSRVDARIDRALRRFGDSSFTTKQFIDQFEDLFPGTWAAIVDRYGIGGKGTGTIYTSSSFVGTHLEKRKYNRSLLKLDRVRSPAGWGNPWITVWANLSYSGASLYPDEIPEQSAFLEGAKTTITVNKYERSDKARKACIQHYGARCVVCRMEFAKSYGNSVEGFIHVHHIKPLSSIDRRYKVDPINDLRPVCPNCHAVIHANGVVLSITQARTLMRRATRRSSG